VRRRLRAAREGSSTCSLRATSGESSGTSRRRRSSSTAPTIRSSPIASGRALAEAIPGARFVELSGRDNLSFVGDVDELVDEVEEFLTGRRAYREPTRVLATVLFTDIADSTRRAAELGDRRGASSGDPLRGRAPRAQPPRWTRDQDGRRRLPRPDRATRRRDQVRQGDPLGAGRARPRNARRDPQRGV
jgi:hypothetical protein